MVQAMPVLGSEYDFVKSLQKSFFQEQNKIHLHFYIKSSYKISEKFLVSQSYDVEDSKGRIYIRPEKNVSKLA